MGSLFLYLIAFFAVYAVLPGLAGRLFGFRVFKQGRSGTGICLTFDDGPDPVYTPVLLDLLREHGAKATFFVVGKHAEEHPEIIRRMHEEGHAIGVHNYVHRTNWLMGPKSVANQIGKTSEIVERITGVKPTLYRPPWGILNLFDFFRRNGMHLVLWSAMAGDWRRSTGVRNIADRMLKRLQGGAVYLLHDCGKTFGADPDAPENTIRALETFLPTAKERGFRMVRVDEMINQSEKQAVRRNSIARRCAVSAWLLWERCFHALFRLKPAVRGDADSFLFYRIASYRGETIKLSDGEELRSGDRIVELHMNNKLLYELGSRAKSPVQLAIRLIRIMENAMPGLAGDLMTRPDIRSIKAVLGTSMVNRGVEQFGFTVTDLPKGWFAWAAHAYLKLLLAVIHPEGADRLGQRNEMLVPKRIAISINEVMRRYGTGVAEAAAGSAPSK